MRETAESVFDEANVSQDANQVIFDCAEDKLQNLALQLGESCLTNDLAALMS